MDFSIGLKEKTNDIVNKLIFENLREIARKQYNDANCKYNDGEYIIHIDMVVNLINTYKNIFNHSIDTDVTIIAALYHDSIEDAKQTYNDICKVAGTKVADVVLAVTDMPAENRLMKHLFTMSKTVKDYRAIILKMCDIDANASFSKANGSSMYAKYVEEYQYRRPIFQKALTWYKNKLNQDLLKQLWDDLDEVHTVKYIYNNLHI